MCGQQTAKNIFKQESHMRTVLLDSNSTIKKGGENLTSLEYPLRTKHFTILFDFHNNAIKDFFRPLF